MVMQNSGRVRGSICFMIAAGLQILCMTAPAVKAEQPIPLSVVYYYTSESGKELVKKLLDEYQTQHPNLKLNIQLTTQAKVPEILKTRALAKDLPDVAMITPQMVGEWAQAGLLQEGNKYIPDSVLKVFDPIRSLSGRFNDKIYGLPESCSIRAVAYNADYFKKAGIVPPQKAAQAWTWDELVAAAKKAQQASGAKYALQFEKPSFDGWMPFLYEAGGQLLDNSLTKPAINSPQARRALEWTAKLHREGLAAPGVIEGTEDPLRIFASGLCTLWLATGNWMMDALEPQMKFKYGFTFLPKDVQQATVVGGVDWVAFKGKYPKESWDLLLYLVSPKVMSIFNTVHTCIPPRSDVTVQWSIKPELARFFVEQSELMPKKLQIDQLTTVYAATRVKLLQELSACVSGQQSVDKTLTAMEKIIADNLK